MTFTEQEINTGRKVFNTSCGTCHAGGITKTNHNVGLDPETLALATPPRDNVDALVDYMNGLGTSSRVPRLQYSALA